MFSLLSNIFSPKEAIKSAGGLLDEAFYTEAEKAENKLDTLKLNYGYKVDLLKAYQPFKLIQRTIAFAFTFIYLFIMINGILGSLYGWVPLDNVNKARNFADDMWLGEIMLTIIGFYFGGGLVNSIKDTNAK